jgi:hypothetical protein
MAKITDIKPGAANEPGASAAPVPGIATIARALPPMGSLVYVQVAPGATLINNETGGTFAPDTPTPQTVTVTLLRRLADGDLVLAPRPAG